MRLAFFLRSIVLVLIAAGITISWTRVDDPEPVAIDFLNARSANLGYAMMLLVCFVFLVVGSGLLLKVRGQGQPR